MFSSSAMGASEVVRAVKLAVSNIPISAKLSANVPDIGAIARECEKAGADCITAINTMPAMWIDARAKKPVLSNAYGGLSGPALLPIALRAVHSIRKTCPKIPIIGGGGVSSGEDAARMLIAGATAVSIGSAVYYRKNAFGEIKSELEQLMKEEKYSKVTDIKFVG